MNHKQLAILNNLTYRIYYNPSYRPILKNGWEVYIRSDEISNNNSGFFATSYLNHKCKELVIISTGTSCFEKEKSLFSIVSNPSKLFHCLHNIYADFHILFKRHPHSMVPPIISFTNHIINSLHEHSSGKGSEYKVTISGHSLGTFNSKIIAHTLALKGHKTSVVNFESIGAASFQNYLQQKQLDIQEFNFNLTTYNAPNNFINSLSKEVGEVVKLDIVPYKNKGSIHDNLMSLVHGHSMDEIIDSFKISDDDLLANS